MFITVEKVKIIGVILMIILALGIFSKFFEKSSSGKEGFQMDSSTVKIDDIQNNLIMNSSTVPIPLYQPNKNYNPINIEKNAITMIPDGYYMVDNITIAMLPTGNAMNPFPIKMKLENIPPGYFKYTSRGNNYLAQIPVGYYIVDNAKQVNWFIQNMATLPIDNIVGPIPDLNRTNIPSGYYINKNRQGLVKIPSGYYIIDNTYMAKLPSEDTITPPPNISIKGITIPNGYYINSITNPDGSVSTGLSKIPPEYKYAKLADGITDDINNIVAKNPDSLPRTTTYSNDTPTSAPEITTTAATTTNQSLAQNTPVTVPDMPTPGVAITNSYSYVDPNVSQISPEYNSIDTTQNGSTMNGNVIADSTSIVNENTSLGDDPNTKYDPANYTDVTYHDTPEDIMKQTDGLGLEFGSMTVVDATGKKISYPYVPGQGTPTYYTPGSFVFGPSNYVPNYEDSVYLSRTTGLSTVSTAVPANSVMGGFCSSTDKTAIEQKCNSIPADQCASTSCCVLLGGTKCVSGDDKGPTMKSNYTDPTILTKDYYYYQGKCYGLCQ